MYITSSHKRAHLKLLFTVLLIQVNCGYVSCYRTYHAHMTCIVCMFNQTVCTHACAPADFYVSNDMLLFIIQILLSVMQINTFKRLCQTPSNDLLCSKVHCGITLVNARPSPDGLRSSGYTAFFSAPSIPQPPWPLSPSLSFSLSHTVSWMGRVGLRQCFACVLMQTAEH